MWDYFRQKAWAAIPSLSQFIRRHILTISVITGLAAIIGLLQKVGLWSALLSLIKNTSPVIGKLLITSWSAPVWIWVILLVAVLLLSYFVARNAWYIGKVAGEFSDDFKRGLDKWEYSGDWRIEEENGRQVLSVANSDSGGFTKKGFTWSDYEFSFETEIVRIASGWVIRANQDNFFMVQLHIGDTITLRPHHHVREGIAIIWHPDDERSIDLSTIPLKNPIRLLQWIKVKIVVEGNQVDVYLDDVHALHYLISRVGTTIQRNFTFLENGVEHQGTINEPVILGDYNLGRIGFRSAPNEHAHFRNVKVKPL